MTGGASAGRLEVLVPDEIRARLRAAFLDERDLVDVLRQELSKRPVPDLADAETGEVLAVLPVPRLEDLETAELRRVTVRYRLRGAGVEILALYGLEQA